MNLKSWAASSKVFIIALILSIALLAYIGSTTYKQMAQLRNSVGLITHTLTVEKEINSLFSHYAMMQSKAFDRILRLDTLDAALFQRFKKENDSIYNKLKGLTSDNAAQQQRLEEVKKLERKLFFSLEELFLASLKSDSPQRDRSFAVAPVSDEMQQLEHIKDQMLKEEDLRLEQREVNYRESVFFTPLMTLLLGIFALSVFLFSFWRINKQRKQSGRTQLFLESVLKNTDNVISYFTPRYGANGNIIDFNIEFSNKAIETVLNKDVKQVQNRLMSDLLPINFENGIFDELAMVAKTRQIRQFEKRFDYEGKQTWFATIATPLNNGVLTTSTDTTIYHETQKKQQELTERLEAQNLELLDNRAFLGNIFKSTSNVVMHFKSIRDAEGKIMDFEILFINDAINEITGDIPAEVKHKKVSEIYPTIFKSGVFEKLVTCIEEDREMNYETKYEQEGQIMWFRATAIKLNDGVTVTTREITEERRKTKRLKSLNEQLAIQNSIFKDAEEVANIGSYVGYLSKNEAWVSDNFYRILGHEPNDFEMTFERYVEFVHPDDLEIYGEIRDETLGLGSARTHQHRIITKDGTVKYVHVNGQKMERNGKEISIGVVQDITERVNRLEELRQKNKELLRSNAELEAFNRVASHDLQEPIRKIQLFIERIADTELEHLSEKGKTYFEKVANAANRMQTLIKYLLAYSRLNTTRDDFEKLDLGETMNKVLDTLEERIQESGTEITVGQLPVIKGIPFQIEQLLNNLISNAIKYRTTSETPKIVVDCKRISRKKISEQFEKKHSKYYRVSVMDNGIGFDNVHAEKIFGLFERLHQKHEYSGTGIGLAICKKIAETHEGHIVAESEKGKGATFCVYLPA
ncbi:Multi-sensor signal transduction histidine kinase [Croceitalea dokdonensis DOKDO 023]|uniref:histidine kinase n=1 Tax=Croceitalea dokdonensis DOKDO 023 TaxID=1300341 RepID=A0A0P7AW07_9FLAO|nr:ATP-binding protein [Croceitalea dokdonensis]KPM32117.1 Multi-sensor signal transduction histidine kinase [Croceitalea dokdonensis DOKDO 023]